MEGFVTVYYRGTVRKQDCWFENMEQELEMFDEAPSFNDLSASNGSIAEVVVMNGQRIIDEDQAGAAFQGHGCVEVGVGNVDSTPMTQLDLDGPMRQCRVCDHQGTLLMTLMRASSSGKRRSRRRRIGSRIWLRLSQRIRLIQRMSKMTEFIHPHQVMQWQYLCLCNSFMQCRSREDSLERRMKRIVTPTNHGPH